MLQQVLKSLLYFLAFRVLGSLDEPTFRPLIQGLAELENLCNKCVNMRGKSDLPTIFLLPKDRNTLVPPRISRKETSLIISVYLVNFSEYFKIYSNNKC